MEAQPWPNLTSKATRHNTKVDRLLLLSNNNGTSSNLREVTKVATDIRDKLIAQSRSWKDPVPSL
jgi:hypothetical protein